MNRKEPHPTAILPPQTMPSAIETQSAEIEYLQPREAGRRFSISVRTLETWMAKKVIESHRVTTPGRQNGGRRLIRVESLRRFITGQTESTAPEKQEEGN